MVTAANGAIVGGQAMISSAAAALNPGSPPHALAAPGECEGKGEGEGEGGGSGGGAVVGLASGLAVGAAGELRHDD